MNEIRAEIRSLIDKHKIDKDAPINLSEEDLTSALVVLINRERKEVTDFAVEKISGVRLNTF